MLHIASLGHGNHAAVIADVQDAVLLENGAEHVLDDNRGGRIGDKARFFVKLLGKEINSQVAVLTGLSRGGDTDNLTGTTLEDQEIANADVMAGNGNGVSHSTAALNIADGLTDSVTDTSRTSLSLLLLDDHLFALVLWMERVKHTFSGMLKPTTDGVVPAFVVVVTHAWTMRLIYGCFGSNSFLSRSGMTTLEFNVVIGVNASSVFTFGDVDFFFRAVVVRNFDINLGISVAAVWISVEICSDFYLWVLAMALVMISSDFYLCVIVVAVMSV